MFDAQLKRIQTGDKNRILFEIPKSLQSNLWSLIKKFPTLVRVRIGSPRKMRTTGDLSQNHKIAALCNAIGEETGHTYNEVKMLAKYDALAMGYPYRWVTIKNPETGQLVQQIEPYHENELDTQQASILIEALLIRCADLGIQT